MQHSRNLARFLRVFGLGEQTRTPEMDGLLQSVVVVDDVAHLAPPVRFPTYSLYASRTGIGGVFPVFELTPAAGGLIVRGASNSIPGLGIRMAAGRWTPSLITANIINQTPGVSLDSDFDGHQAICRVGTAGANPEATLGIDPGEVMESDIPEIATPLYIPFGQQFALYASAAGSALTANVSWVECRDPVTTQE